MIYCRQLVFCLTLGGLAGLLPTSVLAQSCPDVSKEALKWLDRMSHSSHHIAYHGVVTLQRGDDMQVMQISHSVNGDAASEELTKLTGQGAQVIRERHPLQCLHTGPRLLQIETTLSASSSDNNCGVGRYYRFSVMPGERIAGRRAVTINVEPRDMYRYGYRMELDSETGLLLRSTTIGRGQIALERFQFANLSYGSPLPADISNEDVELIHEASHPDMTAAGTRVSPVAWALGWLPSGFAVTEPTPGSRGRLTYTDGLAAFSVFVEPLSTAIKPGEGVAREGSTMSYTRGLELDGRPILVTVIGEVPVNTARMVADSIHWMR
ncbi:MAG: MucB/RseB C-terminal domain-containing protein [Parahaliea sp.]